MQGLPIGFGVLYLLACLLVRQDTGTVDYWIQSIVLAKLLYLLLSLPVLSLLAVSSSLVSSSLVFPLFQSRLFRPSLSKVSDSKYRNVYRICSIVLSFVLASQMGYKSTATNLVPTLSHEIDPYNQLEETVFLLL